MHYDTIIIGTGPAGEGAAMHLAKAGKKVAIVEKYKIGGSNTHWGTIPSKALRHAVERYEELINYPIFETPQNPDIHQYLKMAEKTICKQEQLRTNFYENNEVDIYFGTAQFLSAKKIEILEKKRTSLSANYFIIATGTSPYRPPEIDFSNPKIIDSNKILQLDYTPHSCTIYGAGVIGCEYASILSSMKMKLNLVHQRDKLLSFLDEEIVHALNYNLQNKGVNIFNNEEFESLEEKDNKIIIHTKSSKRIKADILFWANGREGNTKELHLQKCSLESDHRGMLKVNSFYQTNKKHIYAVGDVIGYPSLASVSYDQGRIVASHILGQKIDNHFQIMPNGIYTTPEISSIGKTEQELTKEGIPYEVGRALFKNIARAQITNQTIGMLKIIFHLDNLKILGVHCFGSQASEIIHIGQAIMTQKENNSIMYFINNTFNYPTMAEAYRIAALNGINRI